ncbi:MAG: anion permease [Candidatus Bipolaricaulota bacterium]|nr:anion permease [Candidatus Bipolaricaulota bacterium]
MWALLPALLLGWALGGNNAANVCGLAVATGALRYRSAVLLAAAFVLLGSALAGTAGLRTYSALAALGPWGAFAVALVAGLTVAALNRLGLPGSTSQVVVGAILGVALAEGRAPDLRVLGRIGLAWVTSPLGGLGLAFLLHRTLTPLLARLPLRLEVLDRLTRAGLLGLSAWGAFALGANNVANVTGVFVGAGLLPPLWAGLLGGAAIALGVLTYGRRVMETLGHKLTQLGTWPALLALVAHAAVLQAFTAVGVPVSSSFAVVGGVVGVGLARGVAAVNLRTVGAILAGWLVAPAAAGALAFAFRWGLKLLGC